MSNVPAKTEKIEGAALAVITAAEIDRQVATAKQYPRDKAACLTELRELVTSSEEVALACFYTLEREELDKATGKKVPKFIVGPSVRFAELLVYCWQNLRVATRIVDEGAEFLTAQGIAHDLERNNAVSAEVRRRITTAKGHRYGADMIGVTGAAASSIAFRNAVFDLIPAAVWNNTYQAARVKAVGDKSTISERIVKAIETFVKAGATEAHIYPALGVETRADMTADHLILLAGLWSRVLKKEIEAAKIFHPDAGEERERIGLMVREATPAIEKGGKGAAGSRAETGGANSTASTRERADQEQTKPDPAKEDSPGKPIEGEKKADAPDDPKKIAENTAIEAAKSAQAATDEEAQAEAEAVAVDLELVTRVELEVAAAKRGHKLQPILDARGALQMISETSPSPDAKARALKILNAYELPEEKS